VDLDAVRTFVAAADRGRFQDAAEHLAITQQAVSKRVAALERELAVRLFARTSRGVVLTLDGQALLPHARELLQVAARAAGSVRRALRVDVHSRRIAPAGALEAFHRAHPDVALDIVALTVDVRGAVAAVEAGTVDATFHAAPPSLPATLAADHVLDDPHELLVGPRHPLADAAVVTPAELAGLRIRMPGLEPGSEWADYYDAFGAAFSLTIDTRGPVFGYETFHPEIAASAELATLIGEGSRYLWPDRYDLRRIPVRQPTPVYPTSLIRRADNHHPGLARLREHLLAHRRETPDAWRPLTRG
jgi:DNA-binding transcriptional LysR family regulator